MPILQAAESYAAVPTRSSADFKGEHGVHQGKKTLSREDLSIRLLLRGFPSMSTPRIGEFSALLPLGREALLSEPQRFRFRAKLRTKGDGRG